MIGGKHFGLKLKNHIFPRYAVFTNHIANYVTSFNTEMFFALK